MAKMPEDYPPGHTLSPSSETFSCWAPHRGLQKLAKKHGPIMSIRLGNVLAVVVSSPYYAELFLKTHDNIFASRPKMLISEYMHQGKGMAFSEYGEYWRNVRKLCTLELLTESKIRSFKPIRREVLEEMVELIKRSAMKGELVDVSTKVAYILEDITCKMIFGRCKDERLFDLKSVFHEYSILVGAFNISEYVAWLAPLDLQGLTRRIKAISMTIDEILEMIINDHEQDIGDHPRLHNDFTGLLLSLMNDHKNSTNDDSYNVDRIDMKAIMLDMLSGTMDTTIATSQWIFLNLMKHPRVMKKLQEELETVVGLDNMVQEEDLTNLLYLKMVIKESLRLYPVGPLLVPHESIEETIINGYLIPKKTRVIVNVWTIGRDSEVWSHNAEDFYPERFESNDVDYRSGDFHLLSFGYGRRGCPGMQLGLKMVQIVVAQLVHCFEWELPMGKLPFEVDMSEKFGIGMPPTNNLFVVPTYRLNV